MATLQKLIIMSVSPCSVRENCNDIITDISINDVIVGYHGDVQLISSGLADLQ